MSRATHLVRILLALAIVIPLATGNASQVAGLPPGSAIAAPTAAANPSLGPQRAGFDATLPQSAQPQHRAERALKMAIDRVDGAADYVLRYGQNWRGRIQSNDKLAALIVTAMNSSQTEVRMAGFEMQLAVDGVAKTPQEVEHLIQRLHDDPKGVGSWELWHLGALGARGVDRERILGVLIVYSHSRDDELRRWAVESLNLFGGSDVIDPLLSVAANDSSPTIRDRAFCGLAQLGMIQPGVRYRAIPGLVEIAQNPGSDPQTVDWSYEALRDITGIRDLPQQPALWRARLQSLGLLKD